MTKDASLTDAITLDPSERAGARRRPPASSADQTPVFELNSKFPAPIHFPTPPTSPLSARELVSAKHPSMLGGAHGISTGGPGKGSSRRARRLWLWVVVALAGLVWYLDVNATRRQQAEVMLHSVANRLAGGQAPTVALERTLQAAHLDLLQPGGVPTTKVLTHSPGFTVIDNLFVWNATMYLVSDTPEDLPPLVQINKGPSERAADFVASDPYTIQTIPSAEAVGILGNRATRLRGVSFIWKDLMLRENSRMLLESLLGSWKVYAHAVAPDGTYHLPFPDRIIHPLLKETEWRDTAGMNSFIIKSAFPAVTAAYAQDWQERAEYGFADVYDRVVLFDRRAAHNPIADHPSAEVQQPSNLPLLTGVAELATHSDFWLAVRDSLLQSIPPSSHLPATRPVVTYVSRQKAMAKRVATRDHQALVKALKTLEERYEIHIVDLPSLSRHDQVHLAARTDIWIGPHGEGLTHLLWLPHHSTVIEILPPQTWSRTYALPAQIVGHRYFAVWNDTVVRGEAMNDTVSSPDADIDVPELPVRSAPILRLIEDVLAGEEPPAHRSAFPDG